MSGIQRKGLESRKNRCAASSKSAEKGHPSWGCAAERDDYDGLHGAGDDSGDRLDGGRDPDFTWTVEQNSRTPGRRQGSRLENLPCNLVFRLREITRLEVGNYGDEPLLEWVKEIYVLRDYLKGHKKSS